jgi:hypothetical protein
MTDVDLSEPDQELGAATTRQRVETAEERLVFSVPERRAFFGRVIERTRTGLSPELGAFTARPVFNLVKLSYENERVHYEVAIDNARRLLEIGLHFEDGPASTLAYLDHFGRQIVELKHLLGPEIELERWTASWGRLYELWPLDTLARTTADRAAARLATYIATLQPRLLAAEVKPERSADPSPRGPWRRFKR